MTDNSDAARQWRDAYERVADLAHSEGDEAMSVSVPATPDWTARELLAHMVGVGVDTLTGEVPDDRDAEWTQHHVDQRRDVALADLLEEWGARADDIERYVRETDPSPLGDIVIHEQDLRGALSRPGARDTDGLAAIREQMIERLDDAIDDTLPAVTLRASDSDWTWTSGGSGDSGVVISAPVFDLTRAVLSRRTADQLRAWTTQGEVDPYLDAFAQLGPLPSSPLPE